MTGTPDLVSCWTRFNRGEEHMRAVEHSIADWARRGPYAFRHQANPEMTRFALIAEERVPPDLPRWALLTCEAFANLRSSLDHAIWAIGEHEGAVQSLNEAQTKAISFPIIDRAEDFLAAAQKGLRGFSSEVTTAVRAFQPYNRPHRELPPLLRVLRHIDNVNKHRLILPVSQVTGAQHVKVTAIHPPIRLDELQVEVATGRVQDGTEVVALVTRRPQPSGLTFNAHLEFGAAIEIRGAGRTAIRFRNIRVLFDEIAGEVRAAIESLSVAANERAEPQQRI